MKKKVDTITDVKDKNEESMTLHTVGFLFFAFLAMICAFGLTDSSITILMTYESADLNTNIENFSYALLFLGIGLKSVKGTMRKIIRIDRHYQRVGK